ncbi:MAG: hypothetical protein GY919_15800 [Photobacterium aquimaris]|nr:hypothetical protein [Photobacterium aquimaris]
MLSNGNNYIEPNATRLRAVDGGYFYRGKVDTDPTITANQIPIYYKDESGTEQQVEQPVYLNKAGVPVLKNGNAFEPISSPVFSFSLFDKTGQLIEYNASTGDSASMAEVIKSQDQMMGYTFKGNYLPNPVELTNEGDYVLDDNGDRWFGVNLPHTTDPSLFPSPNEDVNLKSNQSYNANFSSLRGNGWFPYPDLTVGDVIAAGHDLVTIDGIPYPLHRSLNATVTGINTTTKPYSLTTSQGIIYLLDIKHYSKQSTRANMLAMWVDNTGVEPIDTCQQAFMHWMGDSGLPGYMPNGNYLVNLAGSIRPEDSNGNLIENFVFTGQSKTGAIFKYSLNADLNFKSPFSFSNAEVNGVYMGNFGVDFNKDRVRSSPSARFHNPIVQCTGGGKNVFLTQIKCIDANVDQPFRLASLASDDVVIDKVDLTYIDFKRFHDGVTGNNQVDISCFYLYANDVDINNCNWDSEIPNMGTETSKGITAIEFYGSDYRIKNNRFTKVNRATIIGNLIGDYETDTVIIESNTYTEVICGVDGSPNNFKSRRLTFQNNTILNRNMGNVLSLPFLLFFSISGVSVVTTWEMVTVKGNTAEYIGTGSYTANSFSSFYAGGDVRKLVMSGSNEIYDQPTGIVNVYVDIATESDVDIQITGSNTFKNIKTGAMQAGNGRPFSFNSTGSKTFKNWLMSGNHLENIFPKEQRGGKGGDGPIVYMNIASSGKNFQFTNNTILGVNDPVRTDGSWISPANEVIQNNYHLSDTDA